MAPALGAGISYHDPDIIGNSECLYLDIACMKLPQSLGKIMFKVLAIYEIASLFYHNVG